MSCFRKRVALPRGRGVPLTPCRRGTSLFLVSLGRKASSGCLGVGGKLPGVSLARVPVGTPDLATLHPQPSALLTPPMSSRSRGLGRADPEPAVTAAEPLCELSAGTATSAET